MPNQKTSFLRDRSGFVRDFNWVDVFVFNVLGYATGLSLATNPTILGSYYPSAQIFPVLIIGFLVSLACGLNYGYFSAIMPRNGGDYIFISRTLGGWVGFIANWGFTFSQIYGIGVFSGWAIQLSLSPAFTTFGYVTNNPTCITIGKTLSDSAPIFWWGLVTLLVCLLLSVLAIKTLKKILIFLFIIAIISTFLMCASFFSCDHESFVLSFNSFMENSQHLSNAYSTILEHAASQGLKLNQSLNIIEDIANGFRALPVGFLIFFGFTYSVYVGGEVRKPQTAQRRGILAALFFALLVSLIGMGRYYSVVGRDFNNAVALVKGQEGFLPSSLSSMVFFSGILIKNSFLNALMSFGSFLWFFLLPLVMIQISVRNIYSWAFDRNIPGWFGQVSVGNRAWRTTIVVILLSCVFLALSIPGFILKNGFPYMNYVALFSICYALTGLAGAVFPFSRKTKTIYETAPSFARGTLLGLPKISWVGGISFVMFTWILISTITNQKYRSVVVGVGEDHTPEIFLVAIYVLGIIVWNSKKLWHKGKDDIDPKDLFSQLPPE